MSEHRVSQRAAQDLAARLSQRDRDILSHVARHRFVTSIQLRRTFFTDHATPSAATRACTRVLDRLLAHRLLTRLERRIGGTQHGSGAFVWCLDVIGHRLTSTDNTRRRFHEPSRAFLAHTLQVTETHTRLREAATSGAFQLTRVEIETEAWRSYVTNSGAPAVLKPDLMVTISSTAYDDHWYLEIDLGTESLPILLKKCRAYHAYQRTGRAQTEHGAFPRVLWSMPTPARAARLDAALTADTSLPRRVFTITTTEQLLSTLQDPPP